MAFGDVLRSWALPGGNTQFQGCLRYGGAYYFLDFKATVVRVLDVVSLTTIRNIPSLQIPAWAFGDKLLTRVTGGVAMWDPNAPGALGTFTRVLSSGQVHGIAWTGGQLVTMALDGRVNVWAPTPRASPEFVVVRSTHPTSYHLNDHLFTLGWDGARLLAAQSTPAMLVVHDPAANYAVVRTGPAPVNDSVTAINMAGGTNAYIAVGGTTNRLYEVSLV